MADTGTQKAINCNKCGRINITEELQQTHPGINHRCTVYGRRVFHHSSTPHMMHPVIHPCVECVADGHKNYEERRK